LRRARQVPITLRGIDLVVAPRNSAFCREEARQETAREGRQRRESGTPRQGKKLEGSLYGQRVFVLGSRIRIDHKGTGEHHRKYGS